MNKKFLVLSICAFAFPSLNAQAATPSKKDEQKSTINSEIASNPACKNIINACEKSGFVIGQFNEGNGLRKNCIRQILAGKPATQKGKEVTVAVNASDVTACKVVANNIKGEDRENYVAKN